MYTKEFSVEIVTPVEKKFEGTCDEIILPGIEGEMAVLGGHAPLLTMLSPGVTVTIEDGTRKTFATGEGFATIAENRVVCLVDFAHSKDEMDFSALRSELQDLESKLADSPSDTQLRRQKNDIQAKLKVENHGQA